MAEDLIADRLPELIDNLFRLAAGVEVQKTDSNGVERIYSQPPDRQANEYLINRIMGKPTERTDDGGDDDANARDAIAEAEDAADAHQPDEPPAEPAGPLPE